MATRKQCKACPWRVDVDPHTIPNGYCETRHKNLDATIARSGELNLRSLRLMACHESKPGAEIICVGYLDNQLGAGNNIGLRLAVINKSISADYELVGKQHECFEDTLPKKKRRSR